MAGRKTPFVEEPGWSINTANSEARFVSPEEYAAQKKGPSILGRFDELIDMILSRRTPMSKYYLTPGEYEAQQDKQNKNLKVGMWNAEREDKEAETLREQAYRDMMQSKADKAKGIGGLAKLAGAAGGGLLGFMAGGPVGAVAGAGLGSSLLGAGSEAVGGNAGQTDLAGPTATMAKALTPEKTTPPTATPTPEPVGMPFGEAKAPGLTEESDELALKRKAFETWLNQSGYLGGR